MTRRLLFTLLLLPCAGCGVKAYEDKFSNEVERIKKFDEADQALGNPLLYPQNVGTKQKPQYMQQEYLFLRPPLGFSSNSDNIPYFNFLYRFTKGTPSTGGSGGVPAGVPAGRNEFPPPNEKDIGIREIYVAFSMTGKIDDFRNTLLQIFKGAKQLPQPLKIERVGREPIVYDGWTWSDNYKPAPSLYLIYGAQGDSGAKVAIVFRIPEDKAGSDTIKKTIRFVLQSCVLGSAAPNLNKNFRPRKEGEKKSS